MTATDELAKLAAVGLDGAPPFDVDMVHLIDAEALWSYVVRHRLTGFLVEATETNPDFVTPEQREWLAPRVADRMRQLMMLEERAAEMIAQIEGAGAQVGLVKGAALARSTYRHHWWRDFGDLDLLVDSSQFDRARAVLAADSIRPLVPPVSRHAPLLLGKGITLAAPEGFEVDLHHTLLAGEFGFGRSWDFWMAAPTVVTIGDQRVLTTGPRHTALHMCAHLVIGGPVTSVHTARDVAEALAAIDPNEPAARHLHDLVAELQLDGLVETAIDRCDTVLGVVPPSWAAWRAGRPIPDEWAGTQARFTHQTASFGVIVRAALRRHRTPVQRLRIVRTVLWPDAEHLNARGLSRRAVWRDGARSALR